MTVFAGQKARRKRAVFPYIRERYRQPADFFKNLPVFLNRREESGLFIVDASEKR